MGLFDKMLKRKWHHFRDRGYAHLEKGELGLACQELHEALSRFKGEDAEREEVETKLREAEAGVRERQIARAEEFLEHGAVDRARLALESALEYSHTEAEKQELTARIEACSQAPESQLAPTGLAADVVIDANEMDEDHRIEVMLAALPEDDASRYRALGDAFVHGALALQEGRFEEALSAFREADKAHPDEPVVQMELGRVLHAQGEVDEALGYLRQASEGLAESIPAKLHLTRALWDAELFDEAEAALQEAHDMDEEDTTVFRAIGEHSLRTGEYEPGIEALKMILEDAPRDVAIHRMLGQLHQAKGDLEEALGCYETVNALRWNLDPETRELVFDPFCALQAAFIYIEQEERLNRAIDLLFAMLTVTEGASAANIHTGIAKAFTLKKKSKKAREHLEMALSLTPESESEQREDIEKRLSEL